MANEDEQPQQDDQPVEGLPAPPPMLTLVLTVEAVSGKTDLNYIGEPEWAMQVLRGMADQVEADIEARRKAAEELL
jgi:hypothetical protein